MRAREHKLTHSLLSLRFRFAFPRALASLVCSRRYEMQVKVQDTMKHALEGFVEKKNVNVEAFWCLGNLLLGEDENR